MRPNKISYVISNPDSEVPVRFLHMYRLNYSSVYSRTARKSNAKYKSNKTLHHCGANSCHLKLVNLEVGQVR